MEQKEFNKKENIIKNIIPDGLKQKILKPLIIYGSIIIVIIVGLNLSFSYIKKQIASIKDLKSENRRILEQTEVFGLLKRDARALLSYSEALDNLVPSKNQLLNFMTELNNLANNHNLELGLIFKDSGAKDEKKIAYQYIDEVNFTITIKGRPGDFVNFIKDLKTFPYFVDFNSFNIVNTLPESKNIDEITSYNIEGRIFIKK